MAKRDQYGMPRALRESFGWAIELSRLIEKELPSLVTAPVTTMARVKKRVYASLDEQIDTLGPEQWLLAMWAALAQIPDRDWSKIDGSLTARVRRERRAIARTPQGEALLGLVDAAHATVRNSPLLVLPNPETNGMANLEARSRLAATRGLRGEERAIRIRDAGLEVTERLYHPYLQVLWKLADLADGMVPRSPPAFGKLVEVLAERLSSRPSLVEADAAHVRNAIAHGRATYVPSEHALEMHDAHGWRRTLKVRDLEAIIRKMFTIAAETYPRALSIFMEEAFIRPTLPFLRRFAQAVAADDHDAMERVGAEINGCLDGVFADIARLHRGPVSNPGNLAAAAIGA